MLTAVVDTSVIVRGILSPTGHAHEIFEAWQSGLFNLVTSVALLAELQQVLSYPRLKKYGLPPAQITRIIANLRKYSLVTLGKQEVNVIKVDPADNMVLCVALEAEADYIVTADYHLRDLQSFQDIPILWPGEFLQELSRYKKD